MNDGLEVKVYKGLKAILTAGSNVRQKHNHGISISNSRLVECLSGEYLTLRGYQTGSVFGEPGVPHSTFTAFLVDATG